MKTVAITFEALGDSPLVILHAMTTLHRAEPGPITIELCPDNGVVQPTLPPMPDPETCAIHLTVNKT